MPTLSYTILALGTDETVVTAPPNKKLRIKHIEIYEPGVANVQAEIRDGFTPDVSIGVPAPIPVVVNRKLADVPTVSSIDISIAGDGFEILNDLIARSTAAGTVFTVSYELI